MQIQWVDHHLAKGIRERSVGAQTQNIYFRPKMNIKCLTRADSMPMTLTHDTHYKISFPSPPVISFCHLGDVENVLLVSVAVIMLIIIIKIFLKIM